MNRKLRLLLPVAVTATAGLVAACGGTTAGAAAGTPAPQSSASRAAGSGGNGNGGGGAGRFGGPAASGTIAQVNTASIEVQNPSTGQSTVTFTAHTAFTQQQKTSAAAITVGSCVVARSATSGGPATTVQVTKPVNGSCLGGGFGGAGFGGGSRPSVAPTGFPSGRPFPSGAPSGTERRNFGDVVIGKVTAVSVSKLTVAAVAFRPRSSSSAPGAGASATPTARTVTLAANATVTSDATVTKRALKVGLCAAAFGSTDQRGAVAATRIALSSPVSGQCTVGGFGRRGNG